MWNFKAHCTLHIAQPQHTNSEPTTFESPTPTDLPGEEVNNDDNIDDNDHLDEFQLDPLPQFEESADGAVDDVFLPDPEEVDQDEYVRSLVSGINPATPDISVLSNNYHSKKSHGLLPIEAFNLFGNNVNSKIYYWQKDIHRRLSNGNFY